MENGFSFKRWQYFGFLFLTGLMAAGSAFSETNKQISWPHVPGELIVGLKKVAPGRSNFASILKELSKAHGVRSVSDLSVLKTDQKVAVIRFGSERGMQDALVTLNRMDEVKYAEPNFIYQTQVADDPSDENPGAPLLPNDENFEQLWGLYNTGQADSAGQVGTSGSDINVVPLWIEGMTGSKDVVVAVIDTGVQWDHPDLEANLFTNSAEIPDNGIDDDENGFIDDVHGWNFVNNSNDSNDDHNHGTHCSGTIAGVGNNGVGVTGVAWNAKILPVKFLGQNGGSTAGAIESINYARMMGVHIMSNSWGGGGYSEALKDAIIAARDAGILFVAAAGNSENNNDFRAAYPASYQVENIVSVAATDNRDQIADFSSYGKGKVHVAAPGVKVYSTVKDSKYASFSGTSMATPHVSGIAALILSYQDLDYAAIKERLVSGSDPLYNLRDRVVAGGRVNAYNAFYGIVPPSIAPDASSWVDQEYALESEHPYKNNKVYTYTIHQPGAAYIRVHFDKIDVENGYDVIKLEDADGIFSGELSGEGEGQMSGYVKGDTVVVKLKTDYSEARWGFSIDKVQVIPVE